MPRVKMKIEAFGSLAEFSKEHPAIEFKLLTSGATNDGHVTLIETTSHDPNIFISHLESDPDIESFEILHADEEWSVIQIVQNSDPAPGKIGRETGNPPPFPMIIQDGWVTVEATTSHDQLAKYEAGLNAVGVRFDLLSIMQSYDPTKLLTDRQHEFITRALDNGYYDDPRRCSLTDLAESFGVNKATASGILHRAEGAIIKEFMNQSH